MPKTLTKSLTNSSYQSILSDIEALCLDARKALTLMYWKTGERIIKAEQEGEEKAPYGKQLIKRLSKDLTARFGSGFSEGNLENMRRFYLENRISQPAGKLSLSHQIEALSIKDPKRRKILLEKAIRKNLTRDQFRQLLHNEKISTEPELTNIEAPKEPAQLSVTRSRLYTYKILEPIYLHSQEESVVVDVGFYINTEVPLAGIARPKDSQIVESTQSDSGYTFKVSDARNKDLYTYKALVERVVDGDTIWMNIDCGFNIWIRQKLRLKGIDAPEIDTPEGRQAKQFVESALGKAPFVVIKTHGSDKYDRYLADIFYPPLNLWRASQKDTDEAGVVLEEGVYLNQELLNQNLAKTF